MIPFIEFFNQKIYLYPFLMGAAWGVGFHILRYLNDKHSHERSIVLAYSLVFIFSWLGAKIFYLLTVEHSELEIVAINSNFWLGGGFVFYGGLVGGGLSLLTYYKIKKVPLKDLKKFIPPLLIGHGIGRIGCLMAGCCYGIPYDGMLSIHLHGEDRFPVQALEAFLLLLLGAIIIKYYKLFQKHLVLIYFITYSLIRLFTEQFRGDNFRGIWLYHLSTSEIISIIILILCSFYLLSISISKKVLNR